MEKQYVHVEQIHNNIAPKAIVPVIIKLIAPKSVVDVGCGLGTFVKAFKENGVTDVLGIDGKWCNRELLFKNICPQEFIERDLEEPLKLNNRFDLVICLEVAEHLSPARADTFIEDLISLGDIILFSAAIPGQMGINHLNEQWLSYWAEKFIKYNYVIHDILKPFFWNNQSVCWWYSQNMVLITKREYVFDTDLLIQYNSLNNVIHQQLFQSRNEDFNTIISGKRHLKYYIKLLLKSILYKLKIRS